MEEDVSIESHPKTNILDLNLLKSIHTYVGTCAKVHTYVCMCIYNWLRKVEVMLAWLKWLISKYSAFFNRVLIPLC